MKSTKTTIALATAFSCLFLFSGISSLAFQVTWQGVLAQEVGSDHISVTLIVGIFIFSLGIGAHIGGLLSKRLEARLGAIIMAYAACEIIVAGFGLVSVSLIRYAAMVPSFIGGGGLFTYSWVYFSLLVIPIACMGATLPLIVQIGSNYFQSIGRLTGFMYGANIFGASIGAFITGFFLIEYLGFTQTAWLAASVNILIVVFILALSKISKIVTVVDESITGDYAVPRITHHLSPNVLLVSALTAGFVTLSLEIIIFRLISHYFSIAVYTFPLMLGIYLAMMGAGNVLFGWAFDRFKRPGLLVGLAVFGTVVAQMFVLWVPTLTVAFDPGQEFITRPLYITGQPWPAVPMVTLFMLPVLFASGLFPIMVGLITKSRHMVGINLSKIYVSFALGNGVGALLTGGLLLPSIGTLLTIWVNIGLILLVFVLLNLSGKGIKTGYSTIAAPVLMGVIVIGITPLDYFYHFASKEEGRGNPVHVFEGLSGVAAIYDDGGLEVSRNPITTAGLLREKENSRPAVIRPILAELFLGRPLEKVLVIGMGSGTLAVGLDNLPDIKQVDVAEISQEVFAGHTNPDYSADFAVRHFTGTYSLNIKIADGRRFVQEKLAKNERYDAVFVGIYGMKFGNSANVATLEFFQNVHELLADDGVLEIYSHGSAVRTALEVFENAYLIDGPVTKLVYLTKANVSKLTYPNERLAAYQVKFDRQSHYTPSLPHFVNAPVFELKHDDFVSRFPLNTDDHPILSYNRQYLLQESDDPAPDYRIGRNDVSKNSKVGVIQLTDPDLSNSDILALLDNLELYRHDNGHYPSTQTDEATCSQYGGWKDIFNRMVHQIDQGTPIDIQSVIKLQMSTEKIYYSCGKVGASGEIALLAVPSGSRFSSVISSRLEQARITEIARISNMDVLEKKHGKSWDYFWLN